MTTSRRFSRMLTCAALCAAAVAIPARPAAVRAAQADDAAAATLTVARDVMDGKPLFAYQGPLRIIAAKDSRAARSVRMLQRLEVVRLKK